MKSLATVVSQGASSVVLKIAIVATAAVGGTAMVSSNVFAALTATATNTSGGSITTGTLRLTLEPSSVSGITGGFTSLINNVGPGDTVNRYIDLTNSGTLDAINPTLQIAASPSTTLTTDATNGLQVTIKNCTVAWSNTGTCSGTMTTVLAQTPASTLSSAPQALTLPSTLVGAVSRLQISILLPVGNESVINGVLPVGTVQGLTTAITWSFVETERTGTTTNS